MRLYYLTKTSRRLWLLLTATRPLSSTRSAEVADNGSHGSVAWLDILSQVYIWPLTQKETGRHPYKYKIYNFYEYYINQACYEKPSLMHPDTLHHIIVRGKHLFCWQSVFVPSAERAAHRRMGFHWLINRFYNFRGVVFRIFRLFMRWISLFTSLLCDLLHINQPNIHDPCGGFRNDFSRISPFYKYISSAVTIFIAEKRM